MTITHNETAPDVPSFLELETTGKCQLRCRHCYNSSGPDGGSQTASSPPTALSPGSTRTAAFI